MIPNDNEILKAIETKAVKKAGEKTLYFFLSNYSKEGYFENGSFTPWAERKNKKNTKPILYKSGDMKKSFHIEYGKAEYSISNTKSYSKYHNEGTDKMVARPIIYNDKMVDEIIENAVFAELDKIFNIKK